jgi:hypothetical protein
MPTRAVAAADTGATPASSPIAISNATVDLRIVDRQSSRPAGAAAHTSDVRERDVIATIAERIRAGRAAIMSSVTRPPSPQPRPPAIDAPGPGSKP